MIDRFTSPIHFNRKFTNLKNEEKWRACDTCDIFLHIRYLIEKDHINEITNVNACIMICLWNYDLKGKVT